MKIRLTLVCHCCNKGLDAALARKMDLMKQGHSVDITSRNCHGRSPATMGLDVPYTDVDIKRESVLIMETEDGRRIHAPISTFVLPEVRS